MSIVSIYVEKNIGTGEYELLDLLDDENIFLNFKYKDTKDIAKAFSTYSQSFSIPASKNNIVALNYEFREDLVFNRPEFINAKIYINTKLFKVGFVKVIQAKYKESRLSTFQLDFFTSLTSLKDVIGDALLNTLTADTFTMQWSDTDVYNAITTAGDMVVPLISTSRIWTYLDSSFGSSDIAYQSSSTKFPKAIWKKELRPAIRLSKIVDAIIEQYNLNIECPLFTDIAYTRLFAWCNGDDTTFKYSRPYFIKPYYNFVLTNGTQQEFNITGNFFDDTFTVTRTGANPTKDTDGFTVQILVKQAYTGVVGKFTFIDMRPGKEGQVLHTVNSIFASYPGGGGYSHFTNPTLPISSDMVTVAQPLIFKVQVEWNEYVEWDRGVYFLDEFTVGVLTRWTSDFNFSIGDAVTTSLFSLLPTIKIIDLLSSIFKMFNLSALEDNETHLLRWLTPQQFFADGVEIDYTAYGDITDLTVKKQDKYGKYIFQHKEPNYTSSVAFKKANINNPNEKQFGQLIYDTGNNLIKGEYKLETNVSIMVPRMIDGTNWETYYGMSDEVLETGTTNSQTFFSGTPVTDAFTIFYNNNIQNITTEFGIPNHFGGFTYLQIDFGFYSTTSGTTKQIGHANQFKLINGEENTYTNSIAFKDEVEQDPTEFHVGELSGWTYDKNLFSNYYFDTIHNLVHPRIFLYSWSIILPAFEMQRFDLRNTVVIGNNRFKIEEAQLNLTTGKCSMVLSNIVE